jgi:hypothetical protein
MANERNLKSNAERTPTERKELAAKAGRASGEVRRRQRTYREIFNALRALEVDVPLPDGTKARKSLDEAEMIALHRKAAAGDTKALKLVLDMTGEIEQTFVVRETEGLAISFVKKEEGDKKNDSD